MAAKRGRTISEMGQFFAPIMVSGTAGAPPEGQPTMLRRWGIPTQWFDRPGKWNVVAPLMPPILVALEALRRYLS
jgi:hypothetical protein